MTLVHLVGISKYRCQRCTVFVMIIIGATIDDGIASNQNQLQHRCAVAAPTYN